MTGWRAAAVGILVAVPVLARLVSPYPLDFVHTNLGAEIYGILLTVVLVDWLIERGATRRWLPARNSAYARLHTLATRSLQKLLPQDTFPCTDESFVVFDESRSRVRFQLSDMDEQSVYNAVRDVESESWAERRQQLNEVRKHVAELYTRQGLAMEPEVFSAAVAVDDALEWLDVAATSTHVESLDAPPRLLIVSQHARRAALAATDLASLLEQRATWRPTLEEWMNVQLWSDLSAEISRGAKLGKPKIMRFKRERLLRSWRAVTAWPVVRLRGLWSRRRG